MGTRGLFTFIFKGKKVHMYVHCDAYDVFLVMIRDLAELISEFTIDGVINKFDSLIIVDDNTEPTIADIEKLNKYHMDLNKYHMDLSRLSNDWYSLLHECQGNLKNVFESGYFYSIDDSEQEINATFDFDEKMINGEDMIEYLEKCSSNLDYKGTETNNYPKA
jgi:hypothetical protein